MVEYFYCHSAVFRESQRKLRIHKHHSDAPPGYRLHYFYVTHFWFVNILECAIRGHPSQKLFYVTDKGIPTATWNDIGMVFALMYIRLQSPSKDLHQKLIAECTSRTSGDRYPGSLTTVTLTYAERPSLFDINKLDRTGML